MADQSLHNHVVGRSELDDRIEFGVVLGEQSGQRLCLRHRAWKAVEDEPIRAIGLVEPVAHHVNGHFVWNKIAGIDMAFRLDTERRIVLQTVAEQLAEFIPFLDYDVEIRRIICSTNAIESLNARYRRAVRARGHFPTEQAALKCLYLVTRSLDPTGRGWARWAIRWKPALNAFAITFEGRIVPSTAN
jgi:hypothetical protein